MSRPHRRMPAFDTLEPRIQLSTSLAAEVFPAGFVGPIPTGAVRAGGPSPTPDDTVTGLTLSWPNGQPALGRDIQAQLSTAPSQFSINTTWSYTISYNGYTTPANNITGQATSAIVPAIVPGTYTVTAVSTYTYTGTKPPPPPNPGPTSFNASATAPAPNSVTKNGPFTSAPNGQNVIVTSTVKAGGQNIGPMSIAMAQENLGKGPIPK